MLKTYNVRGYWLPHAQYMLQNIKQVLCQVHLYYGYNNLVFIQYCVQTKLLRSLCTSVSSSSVLELRLVTYFRSNKIIPICNRKIKSKQRQKRSVKCTYILGMNTK